MPAEEVDVRKRTQRSLEILDKEDVERLQGIIEKNYGGEFNLRDFGVMIGSEERIWLASKDVFLFDSARLPVNSIGLNFGKMKKNEKLRLTIEGSQLVGKTAERNVATVSDADAMRFLRGEDMNPVIKEGCEEHNFVIVKTESRTVIGSAMLAEGRLKNFLPKSRRIMGSY